MERVGHDTIRANNKGEKSMEKMVLPIFVNRAEAIRVGKTVWGKGEYFILDAELAALSDVEREALIRVLRVRMDVEVDAAEWPQIKAWLAKKTEEFKIEDEKKLLKEQAEIKEREAAIAEAKGWAEAREWDNFFDGYGRKIGRTSCRERV